MHPDCITKVGQLICDRGAWFLLEQVQSFQSIFVAKGRLLYTGRQVDEWCFGKRKSEVPYLYVQILSLDKWWRLINAVWMQTNLLCKFSSSTSFVGDMEGCGGEGGLIKGGGKNRVVAIQKGNLSLLIHKPSKTQEGPFHCFDVLGSDYGLFSTYPKNKVLNILLIATKSHLKD